MCHSEIILYIQNEPESEPLEVILEDIERIPVVGEQISLFSEDYYPPHLLERQKKDTRACFIEITKVIHGFKYDLETGNFRSVVVNLIGKFLDS